MTIQQITGLSLVLSLVTLLQACSSSFIQSITSTDLSSTTPCQSSFLQEIWAADVDLNRADGSVESAEFSPDGQLIATASRDGRVRMWRVADATLVWESIYWGGSLEDKQGEVEAVSFSKDGQILAAAGDSAGIKMYQSSNGRLIRTLESGEADAVAFTPDGQYLTGADNQSLMVYTSESSDLHYRDRIVHNKGINSIDFTPDNQFVLTAALDHKIKISRLADGALIQEIEPASSSIKSVRVSPDGTLFASANYKDNSVTVFQLSNGQLVTTLTSDHSMEAVDFSPDGQVLVTGGGGGKSFLPDSSRSLQFYQIPDFSPVCSMVAHEQGIEYIDFSPDGKQLVTASEDGTIKLWQIQTVITPN